MIRTALCLLAFAIGAWAQAGRTVQLTWNDHPDNPSETTYNVERANGACTDPADFEQIAADVAEEEYLDNVAIGGVYCYRVMAVFNSLESDPSNTADAIATPHAPTLSVTVQVSVTVEVQ